MTTIGYESRDRQLAVLLQAIQVQDIRSAIVRVYGGGGIDVARARDSAAVLFVSQGDVTVDCPELGTSDRMTPGEFMLLSRGHRHIVRSADGAEAPPGCLRPITADAYSSKLRAPTSIRVGHHGDPVAIWMIGIFPCGALSRLPLFAAMPPIARRRVFPIEMSDFTDTDPHSLGSAETIRRFVDLHVVQLAREYALAHDLVHSLGRQTVNHARVTAALRLIEREPQRDWSVEQLARSVWMSRSAFSAAFTQVVGEPVMNYVAGVRMTRAAMLIRTGAMSILAIAQAAGYGSEAAFSKAFKRKFGASPRNFRKDPVSRAEPTELLAPWDPFLF